MDEKKDSILFGQFLKKYGELRVTDEMIAEAIGIQREESLSTEKCRKFGVILFEEFGVFKDLEQLQEYLKKFYSLKVSLGLEVVEDTTEHYR